MSKAPRKICVITGSRAEYGLLYWLLKELQSEPKAQLQLVVTGTHLSNEYGRTEQFIQKDGFDIAYRVDMLVASDSLMATTKSMGLGMIGFADCLQNLQPDLIVLLGDRYEMLAAATAAMMYRIPIAHIHGGEATEGLIDEAVRHSITKMSHIHFTAADDYRRRVIQLGEAPETVTNVGAVGLEWLHKIELLSKTELSKNFGFVFSEKNIVLVYHPETLAEDGGLSGLAEILASLEDRDESIFISASNADPYGRDITSHLQKFAKAKPNKRFFFESLGHKNFLSLLKNADVILGNSSSGILEAPALGTTTINIGSRQQGRLKSSSVIDCVPQRKNISNSLAKILATPPAFNHIPYGDGRNAAKIMTQKLLTTDLNSILIKKFYDLPHDN